MSAVRKMFGCIWILCCLSIFVTAAFSLVFCSEAMCKISDAKASTAVEKRKTPICAICYQNCSLLSPFAPKNTSPSKQPGYFGLIVVVWSDGTIYWSNNSIYGGRPYHEGIIEPDKLQKYMKAIDSIKGLKEQKKRHNEFYGWDSFYTSITYRGNPPLVMKSWHDILEKRLNVIQTEKGWMPVNGGNRKKMLEELPLSHQDFRRIWDEVKSLTIALIPEKGKPAKNVDFCVEKSGDPWPKIQKGLNEIEMKKLIEQRMGQSKNKETGKGVRNQ